ncbi:MAG: SUMF1/EgtB/PvdO family nonheme iron enzyme [Bacteroidota bacterium]
MVFTRFPKDILKNEELYQDNLPVIGITWEAANEYARWKNKELPEFDQMMKAITGPDNTIYPWGNKICEQCVNDLINPSTKDKKTIPVDQLLIDETTLQSCASWCGAYHLVGNVKEWLRDSPSDNPDEAYIAGCSWREDCRVFGLSYYYATESKISRSNMTGFRCTARSPKKITWRIYKFLFGKFL